MAGSVGPEWAAPGGDSRVDCQVDLPGEGWVEWRSFAFRQPVDLRGVEPRWVGLGWDVLAVGDLLREQAVGPAVNRGRAAGVRRIDQAEDLAAGLVDPVAQVVDMMAARFRAGGDGVRRGMCAVARGDRVTLGVHVHEQWHGTSPRRAGLMLTPTGKRAAARATSGVLPRLAIAVRQRGQPTRSATRSANSVGDSVGSLARSVG